MLNEGIQLLERAVIEEQVDALAGGQLALGVLRVDPCRTAALPRLLAQSIELLQSDVDFTLENHDSSRSHEHSSY